MKNAFILCTVFWILFDALLFVLGRISSVLPFEWPRLGFALLGTAEALLLIWLFLKNEKRTFKNIELYWNRNTLPKFLCGLLIGTIIMTVMIAILVGFTDLELLRSKNTVQPLTWLMYLIVIFPLAWMEELAFRSYTLIKLNTAYGLWWAQLISAVAFALYHVVYGWSWQVAFLGPFVWAFVFGLAAVVSRGIALPTGIHAALNFLQMLTGMKADKTSVWTLELKPNHPTNAQAKLDATGVILQVLVLIIAICCTWWFLRKEKTKTEKALA